MGGLQCQPLLPTSMHSGVSSRTLHGSRRAGPLAPRPGWDGCAGKWVWRWRGQSGAGGLGAGQATQERTEASAAAHHPSCEIPTVCWSRFCPPSAQPPLSLICSLWPLCRLLPSRGPPFPRPPRSLLALGAPGSGGTGSGTGLHFPFFAAGMETEAAVLGEICGTWGGRGQEGGGRDGAQGTAGSGSAPGRGRIFLGWGDP